MIDFHENRIDLQLFHNIIKEVKNGSDEISTDILDSFSKNQFSSKHKLIEMILQNGLINSKSEIVIFGCWYGSILVPVLSPQCKSITGIDLNDLTIRIAKNRLFSYIDNVNFCTGDVFSKYLNEYRTANLFINTSCEHMPPMKEWPYWPKNKDNIHFALQSNNMFGINGHVNCVTSIDEFKDQLPENFKVLSEHELVEERGIRYTLVGHIE